MDVRKMKPKIFLKKTDCILIVFLSLIFLLFTLFSISRIGLQDFHYLMIFFAVAHPVLLFSKARQSILFIGAFEYFLLGLLLFFSISTNSPDQKEAVIISWPNWIRVVLGAFIFLVCARFSATLLKGRDKNEGY